MSKKKSKKQKQGLVEKVIDSLIPEPRWPFPLGGPMLDKQLELNAAINDFMDDDSMVKYIHVRNPGGYSYTFAYRQAVSGKRCAFVDLAVAVCSPDDQFNKRLGRDLALSRLLNGEYLSLPLASFGVDNVTTLLHGMFSEDNQLGLLLDRRGL